MRRAVRAAQAAADSRAGAAADSRARAAAGSCAGAAAGSCAGAAAGSRTRPAAGSRARRPAAGRWLRAAFLAVGVACALAAPSATAQESGQQLFQSSCSACHGGDAKGVPGKGPSLVGVGAAAADFYLETGRMPLGNPSQEPARNPPAFNSAARQALTRYIASLGAGPDIPQVHQGDANEGFRLFRDHCAGCHAITARGGVAPPGAAPALQQATSTQIAEAVRIGPYLMPRFDERQISDRQLDSIVAYVQAQRHPDDRGGWGIGNIGPIPEGLVAWLLAGTALLIVARLIGERA